jgi:endonuclease/exonuclease/phosphatase family metal-dependent hydrolase
MGRGILDATVAARGKSYRFLGVHLKSQREVEEGDQDAMRLAEAHLLRKHVDAILKTGPAARLIVYGDFNDNWGTPPIRTIVGAFGTPTYLTAIRASDRMGAYWTHFWKIRDSYSRLDYIAVSQAMKRDTDFAACRVIDDPEWNDASDHRPVMAVFR